MRLPAKNISGEIPHLRGDPRRPSVNEKAAHGRNPAHGSESADAESQPLRSQAQFVIYNNERKRANPLSPAVEDNNRRAKPRENPSAMPDRPPGAALTEPQIGYPPRKPDTTVRQRQYTIRGNIPRRQAEGGQTKKHLHPQVLFLELLPRFELGTSSLPRMCSTN